MLLDNLNQSIEFFRAREKYIFLNHCSVSPVYAPAVSAMKAFLDEQSVAGNLVYEKYPGLFPRFHRALSALLKCPIEDVSYVNSTASALSMIANGYPFESGDEIISYVHEYPSNHYPWKIQERRGVRFKLLPDRDPINCLSAERPRGWLIADLARAITAKTKIVALSHVQFTSGFAADLKEVGELCRERKIDLVIDVAQSLGSLPVYPQEYGIACLAGSGWKWLLGSIGSSIMYTSKAFREKTLVTMAGPEVMEQGVNYLDHSWQPFKDGRKFEYCSIPPESLLGLTVCLENLFTNNPVEEITEYNFKLQDAFLNVLDRDKYFPVLFERKNRSGILSLIPQEDPQEVCRKLHAKKVVCTSRGGYVRVAPHFYNSEEEILSAAEIFNSI